MRKLGELPAAVRESMMSIAAGAALAGHDLGGFEAVDDGHQAECRRCGMTAWVGDNGLTYSLLDDVCPGGAGTITHKPPVRVAGDGDKK